MRSVCVGAVLLVLAGCGGTPREERTASSAPAARTAGGQARQRLTLAELDQLNRAFADRYLTLIGTAADELLKADLDAEQRRAAHLLRLVTVSSVYDIATNADPWTALLDLVLVTTLQSQVWIDDDRVTAVFGDAGAPLVRALRAARRDIWEVAATAMTGEQLQVLDWMIWDWRRTHPEVDYTTFVRFSDFAADRGVSAVAAVSSGGLLAPVSEATKAVDEVRLLGERAFFYAKRLPLLATWQAEAVADGVAGRPEIAQTLDAFQSLSVTLTRLTAVAEALPGHALQQQAELRTAVAGVEQAVNGMLGGYGKAVGETRDLVGLANQTLGAVEKLTTALAPLLATVERLANPPAKAGAAPPAPPLDANAAIRDAGAALDKLAPVLTQLERTLASVERLSQSPAVDQRLQQAERTAESTIDRLLLGLAGLAVLVFALAIAYRLVTARIARRTP